MEGVVDDPALSREEIARDHLSLVASPCHPWAQPGAADAADFTTVPWVLREPGSATRSNFEAVLVTMGLSIADLEIAMVLPSNEAVRVAVEAGAGAAVTARYAAAPGLMSGALIEIRCELPARPFHMLRRKQRYRSKAGDVVVALSMAEASGGRPEQPPRSR